MVKKFESDAGRYRRRCAGARGDPRQSLALDADDPVGPPEDTAGAEVDECHLEDAPNDGTARNAHLDTVAKDYPSRSASGTGFEDLDDRRDDAPVH